MPYFEKVSDYSTHYRARRMPRGFREVIAKPVRAKRFVVGNGEHSFLNVLVTEWFAKVNLLLWG